jgi:hypothetical protein
MPVEIPEFFARQIDALGPHFCLVEGKDPSVGGKGWQLPEKLMLSTDPRLRDWLARGGNYGVVCGYGLVVVEADDDKVAEAVERSLLPTLTVLSGGRRKPHYYYLCSFSECKPLINPESPEREVIGHIKAQGGMVVGPGSIHPETKQPYVLLHARPIAQVTPEQLLKALEPFLVRREEEIRVEEAARVERGRLGDIDIDILEVVPLAGLRRQGDEYFGPHPVHGSTTGRNFWVNPRKNVWHCFRHGTGGGPLLWLAVEEGIIGCEDAGPGVLRGELFRKVLERAVERGLISRDAVKPKAPQPVAPQHLSFIEDPHLAGQPVVVEGVVASTSICYLVPRAIRVKVEAKDGGDKGGEAKDEATYEIHEKSPLNLQLAGVSSAVKHRILRDYFGLERGAQVREDGYRAVYRVRLRPPVFTLEKRGEKIVDERGFEYKAYDIYVVSEEPIAFQPSSLVRLEGLPMPSPRTQRATLLAYRVEFPEEASSFDRSKLDLLKRRLEGMTVAQRLAWILDNFERFSRIVGRRNLAVGGLLAYFTPTWVRFDGELQRGWANVLFCGDTTTAKTETMRKLIRLLGAGVLITAETASTVGLTGTATQLEREGWFVDWGFLVLLDRKLLAVDGAHKLGLSNWAALAEAERSGVVSIAKAAKSTAYARTRQIKIANPVDRESDKYSTKSLSAFLYPCQAVPTILDRTSIARLDLAVFADQRDVPPDAINRQVQQEPEAELALLAEALRWCWSDLAQVEFTDDAVKEIHGKATELYNAFFCEDIPLCSIDMKWKLARLSAALAFLTLSTDDYTKVTVTKEHVDLVAQFIQEEYSKAGLNILAQAWRHEALTLEDVAELLERIERQLANAVDAETLRGVLRYFVLRGRATRDEIRTRFNLAEKSQLRPLLAALSNEGLIKASRGFYPEPKLIQAYKASDGFDPAKLAEAANSRKEPPEKFRGR